MYIQHTTLWNVVIIKVTLDINVLYKFPVGCEEKFHTNVQRMLIMPKVNYLSGVSFQI